MTLSVAEFYAGRHVFITGATGFLGKCLVEKLLRSCPDVAGLHVLVRAKRGVDPRSRVDDLVKGDLFETLKATNPSCLDKILPVCGDLMETGLGIAEDDLAMLRKKVTVVIHVAATVNFNEPIKVALRLNVIAVQELLRLARSFDSLAAFVHTSTAYSQCDRLHIEERFYEPSVKPQALIDMVFSMTDEAANDITRGVVAKRPNTYTLTKSLAEEVIRSEGADLPIAVMRPSIVAGVRADPVRGWLDNLNGPAGMYVAATSGMLRVMMGDETATMDLVPVDHCVSQLIAMGWQLGTQHRAGDAPKVYHCTSGTTNPCTWGEQIEYAFQAYRAHEPFVPILPPSFRFIGNERVYKAASFVLHKVPCTVGDMVLQASGQKPVLNRIYRKLDGAIDAYRFFTTHSWKWDMDNTQQLTKMMSPQDQETFAFDMALISWPAYIESFFVGARRFMPKQDAATKARNKMMQRLFTSVITAIVILAMIYMALFAYNTITGEEMTPIKMITAAVGAHENAVPAMPAAAINLSQA